jgi:hypothetical protein
MKIKIITLILVILAFLLSGCSESESTETLTPTSQQSDLVTDTPTMPTESDMSTGYPINTPNASPETGYPVVDNPSDETLQGPEFSISVPVQAGDLTVSGSGPAEVPLRLVSVSAVGQVLAETVINQEGIFTFNLDEPLEAGQTIGLMLGDLSGTDLNESDFLYSDTYYSRPLIGILFDMVVVQ